MKRRLNIGLIIDDIENSFTNQAALGAELAAKAIDANLLIFPGHYIGLSESRYVDRKYEYQYNSIFTLPTERNVDIIYVLLGTICATAAEDIQKQFLKSMPDVPVISLFSNFKGFNSVIYDNRAGITDAVNHMIDKHGAKKIGFVSGPVTNRDGIERLEAFKQALIDHDMPVDESRIVYGNFSSDSGAVVSELLDRYDDFDAIVFANDSMTVGGYKVFAERGIVPGKDILVSGFDDDIFAVSLEPPLTTIEASSSALVYSAVINAENYINGTAVKETKVPTRFVQRSSCGCTDIDIDLLGGTLKLANSEIDSHELAQEIKNYLFYARLNTGDVFDTLNGFIDAYVTFLKADDKEQAAAGMNEQFSKLLRTDLVMLSTREKFFNVLQTMQNNAYKSAKSDSERVLISETFSRYYRRFAFSGILPADSARRKNERMRRVINREMNKVFLIDDEAEIPYDRLIGSLRGIGLSRSLLYLFQGCIRNQPSIHFSLPTSILLKAVCDDEGVRTLPEEQQLLRTESIFDNEFVIGDERRTMIVSPLFVGDDMYGLMVNELELENVFSVSSVTFQLSASIRSLYLKEEQNRAKRELQNSLERFIRDNTKLEEIAQKDELTRLFNRRGFTANAEKIISDPINQGKLAVICFADMDNLKIVNDKYGHDEGDFALKTLAHVLQESFRDTDIIGRIGGDEFVALAVTGSEVDVESMKERIKSITAYYNQSANKPYPIEMSTGIYKFRITGKINLFDAMNEADRLLYDEKIRKKTGRSFNS